MKNRWLFRVVDVLIGPVILIAAEVQRQWNELGTFDTRLLVSVAIAAGIQVLWHVSRVNTEATEATAEIVTKRDQDDDGMRETLTPRGSPGDRGAFTLDGMGILLLIAVVLVIVCAVLWLVFTYDVTEEPAAVFVALLL